MRREVRIVIDSAEQAPRAEGVKQRLRSQFGHYATKIALAGEATPPEASVTVLIAQSDIPDDDTEQEHLIADIVAEKLVLEPSDLSCREGAQSLEQYRNPNGSLNLLQDPREWILGNAFISELASQHSQYENMVHYVTEQKGLFIKPAKYANQRNYWNSSTNAGLPIVRKRDEVHEGTFMLHDLFHFTFQDPMPVSLQEAPGNEASRRAFLMHRMASEATTLVLADMIAVHEAGLEDRGYDVDKRRIFPVFRDIIAANPDVQLDDIVRANLEFCFSGDASAFEKLRASPEAVGHFKQKYEVFFTADFDWNAHNFKDCNDTMEADPGMREYYEYARDLYGVPTIDTLYPSVETLTIEDVAQSFLDQLHSALEYQPHYDKLKRAQTAGAKYLAGQLLLFYKHPNEELKAQFLDVSQRFMCSDALEDTQQHLQQATELIRGYLDQLKEAKAITSQDRELYMMHVPLYSANFISYDKDSDKYRRLDQKIAELKI